MIENNRTTHVLFSALVLMLSFVLLGANVNPDPATFHEHTLLARLMGINEVPDPGDLDG